MYDTTNNVVLLIHLSFCYLAARRSARLAGSGLIRDVAIGLAVAHHEVEGRSELRDHLFAIHKVHCVIRRPVNDQNLSGKEKKKERGERERERVIEVTRSLNQKALYRLPSGKKKERKGKKHYLHNVDSFLFFSFHFSSVWYFTFTNI